MERPLIEAVRRFSRTVTQRIGALEDAFLARGRPLGQARLLWEISPDGCDVRDLRSRLDLDSGYLSRLLRSLEHDGLVTVEVNEADGRLRTARLTAAGGAERAELDRLSDAAAASLLGPLTERQRGRLVTAMAEVERLLAVSAIAVCVRDPRDPDARYCLRAYVEELSGRFDGGFDPARSISAADHEMTPPAGLFLVATLHCEPVGCGALKLHPGAPAEIKRMWVAPSVRGLGLGAGSWPNWRPAPPRTACASCDWRPTGPSARRSACTWRPATARWLRSTTSPTRTTGSRRRYLLPAEHLPAGSDGFRPTWPSLPVQAGDCPKEVAMPGTAGQRGPGSLSTTSSPGYSRA